MSDRTEPNPKEQQSKEPDPDFLGAITAFKRAARKTIRAYRVAGIPLVTTTPEDELRRFADTALSKDVD